MRELVGLDGCSSGWVMARAARDLHGLRFGLVTNLEPLFTEALKGEVLVLIDIPIGLPEAGPRAADTVARSVLTGSRKSSIFPCPARPALAATGYRDACARNEVACGKKLSQQAYALLPKIAEVDRLLAPELQERVREAHPEVTFALLPGGPPAAGKKTPEGARERLAQLAAMGINFDPARERRVLGAGVAEDDLVDAAACMASARRLLTGTAQVCGDESRDARGLRMEITA